MFFFCPGTCLGHHIILICLISSRSFQLWQFLRLSVLITMAALRSDGQVFVGCPLFWVCLIYFDGYTRVMGFGRETRDRAPSGDIVAGNILSTWLTAVGVTVPLGWGCALGFSTVKWLSLPRLSRFPWKAATTCSPKWEAGVRPHCFEGTIIWNSSMWEICSLHLYIIQSFICISMDSDIYYTLGCNSVPDYLFCCLDWLELFQLVPVSLWHTPIIMGFLF